jgi:hypothetical protein
LNLERNRNENVPLERIAERVSKRNKPKFVILIGEKDHLHVKKHGFIFPTARNEHRRNSDLASHQQWRIKTHDGRCNDFARRRQRGR